MVKDRKLSMEYFKEESKKITQKMESRKKNKKSGKKIMIIPINSYSKLAKFFRRKTNFLQQFFWAITRHYGVGEVSG